MKLKLIKNQEEFEAALSRLTEIFDAPVGSEESDEAEILGVLIEEYENKTCPMPMPSPLSAIKYAMDEQKLNPEDLVPYIGSLEIVHEILESKRSLTLSMIRKLSPALHISLDVLIQEMPVLNEGGLSQEAA